MRSVRVVLIALALMLFTAAALVGSSVRASRSGSPALLSASSEMSPVTGGMLFRSPQYRSPGRKHKLIIDAADARALNEAVAAGAVEVADYGSFKLMSVEDSALTPRTALTRTDDSLTPIDASLRDDLNVLMLRWGDIDTTSDDAPGTRLSNSAGPSVQRSARERGRFRMVQFVGPVKQQWLDELRDAGLDPVAYIPNNGYLVRADSDAGGRVTRLHAQARSRGEEFIQWEGPLEQEYKIHPSVSEQAQANSDAQITVAVQIIPARREPGAMRRPGDDPDVRTAKRLALSTILDAYQVGEFTNLKLQIAAGRISQLAAIPGVVNIEPWSPPRLMDERASQILAANLTDDFKQARGPGYLGFLTSVGLSSRFDFGIDVADTGGDQGSTDAARLHPDFRDSSGQSRLLYARDYTADGDPGDIPGHGTINLSIAGGANFSTATSVRDKDGFGFGIGVAPFALLGSTKIFNSSADFDLEVPYTTILSDAYRDGARIISNSWGDGANQYSLDSQEYDMRSRDAMPGLAGNQELAIVFAAGNAGSDGFISSMGAGKNVICAGASENSRADGEDGCGIENEDADNAQDLAFFSSGGPLRDQRMKPDCVAPGSHIQGAASQHADFSGSDVCGQDIDKPYFPAGQTLYTWSSGTSHSTPQVAGAAALVRQFFLNRGEQPGAALIKAMLLNTTTFLTGARAGGDLPHKRQGWGLINIARAFDPVPKIFINQNNPLGETGQEFVFTGEVEDTTKPFRVTLAWSDAPGFSAAASWVNDLDLEVAINGQVYRGNNFRGDVSQPGGVRESRNNVEGVWLPAGTVGSFVVRVRAANIAGDGIPGNADSSDQDFALVVYNGERKDIAVAGLDSLTITGGADSFADPGETVSMRVSLTNLSPVALNGAHATLITSTSGVTVTGAASDFPNIAPGQIGLSVSPLTFAVDRSVACGTQVQFALDVVSSTGLSRVLFKVLLGQSQPAEQFTDDIESGEGKWTHGSLVKKKKKRVDTWSVSTRRVRSGTHAWFSTNPTNVVDTHLDTVALQLPSDLKNVQLVFFHTFQFEGIGSFGFDGGVLEISSGGDFEDLGPKIVSGGYNGTIIDGATNALGGRPGWVSGRVGALQPVVVDLSTFVGKTVVIRFHFASDFTGGGQGWFIDDVVIRADKVTCTPAP